MTALLYKEEGLFSWKGEQQEGIVVWDQKGLVVLWPDGHCGRFSWLALRQACPCIECQTQLASPKSAPEQEPRAKQDGETPVQTMLHRYSLQGIR